MPGTTWNPADKNLGIALSGGNLIAGFTAGGGTAPVVRAVNGNTTGKFYWECTYNTAGSANVGVGVAGSAASLANGLVSSAGAGTCGINRAGTLYNNGVSTGINFGGWVSGNTLCVAVDCAASLFWLRIGAAGTWNHSGTNDPATGVGGVTLTPGGTGAIYPAINVAIAGDQVTANFGDSAFAGVVPSGYTSGVPGAGGAAATQARAMVLA